MQENAVCRALVLRQVRPWGFWHEGKFIPWREYVGGEVADRMKACERLLPKHKSTISRRCLSIAATTQTERKAFLQKRFGRDIPFLDGLTKFEASQAITELRDQKERKWAKPVALEGDEE